MHAQVRLHGVCYSVMNKSIRMIVNKRVGSSGSGGGGGSSSGGGGSNSGSSSSSNSANSTNSTSCGSSARCYSSSSHSDSSSLALNLTRLNLFSNTHSQSQLVISSVLNSGLLINKHDNVVGPTILLNNSLFLANVPQFGLIDDSNTGETTTETSQDHSHVDEPESIFHNWSPHHHLTLFQLAQPTPEILVIGTGAKMFQLPPLLKSHLHSLGIQVEVQPTKSAASTYNILLQEGRRVAAFILPIVPHSAKTGQILVKLQQRVDVVQQQESLVIN